MTTALLFEQSFPLCSVLNLRIFLVFQLRNFKVGFSGSNTFRGFRETGLCFCSPNIRSFLEILFAKLEYYGIRGRFRLVKNIYNENLLYVLFNNTCSDEQFASIGVALSRDQF